MTQLNNDRGEFESQKGSAEKWNTSNIVFDPTSIEMMKTLDGSENPPIHFTQYVSGSIHAGMSDLEEYLDPPESSGSMVLPSTIPLVNTNPADPLQREAVHGVNLVFQDRQRSTHLLVLGLTGAGKNTKVIDPLRASAIADPGQSIISCSLKAADIGPIRAMCKRAGKRLVIVNLSNPERSIWWNPLETNDADEARDIIRRFADACKNPKANGDSEFWTQCIRAALQGCWEEGIKSFPLILAFFMQPYKRIIDQLKSHRSSFSIWLAEYLEGQSHNAETVLASILGALTSLISRNMTKVLSKNELQLKRLFRKPVCLHIEINESELETQRPMIQILVRSVIDNLISTAEDMGPKTVPTTIFIDDLPSLGGVLTIERVLTLRSRRVGVVAGVQSLSSVELAYGPNARAFVEAFSQKLVLPGCSQSDADFFSHASGESFVQLPGHQDQAPVFANRPLLSAAEIRRPNYSHPLLGYPATCFFGSIAFQAYLQSAYEIPWYAEILRLTKGVTGKERLRRKLPACPTLADLGLTRNNTEGDKGTGLPHGISDSRGWSADKIAAKLAEVEAKIGYQSTVNSSACKWWSAFKKENDQKISLVLRLSEELLIRKATVTDFFLAYVYSNTDNIQANLFYLDYTTLKKEEENKKKKEAEEKKAEEEKQKKKNKKWPSSLDEEFDEPKGKVLFEKCPSCFCTIPAGSDQCRICGTELPPF